MARLGVSEHRWKGVPNDMPFNRAGRERMAEVVTALRAGTLNPQQLLPVPSLPMSAPANQHTADSPLGSATLLILRHLHDVITSLQYTAEHQGLPFDDEASAHVNLHFAGELQQIMGRSAINPQDVLKQLRHAGKVCLKRLCKLATPPRR